MVTSTSIVSVFDRANAVLTVYTPPTVAFTHTAGDPLNVNTAGTTPGPGTVIAKVQVLVP